MILKLTAVCVKHLHLKKQITPADGRNENKNLFSQDLFRKKHYNWMTFLLVFKINQQVFCYLLSSMVK